MYFPEAVDAVAEYYSLTNGPSNDYPCWQLFKVEDLDGKHKEAAFKLLVNGLRLVSLLGFDPHRVSDEIHKQFPNFWFSVRSSNWMPAICDEADQDMQFFREQLCLVARAASLLDEATFQREEARETESDTLQMEPLTPPQLVPYFVDVMNLWAVVAQGSLYSSLEEWVLEKQKHQ